MLNWFRRRYTKDPRSRWTTAFGALAMLLIGLLDPSWWPAWALMCVFVTLLIWDAD